MKNRKLSARVVVSLMLSAILFCMPIGAFFANRTNTIEVHAEDTAEQKTESASDAENTVTPGNGREENSGTDTGEGKTENSTEGTTEDSSEETQPAAKCTCKEKCSQYAVDEDCEVCAKNYKECTYINPSVKITINTPSGWHNDTTKVTVKVEDTIVSGNFIVQTVKAKVGQNGSWTDITEDMYIEISENSTIYVQVTDQKGKTYEKNRYIKCFDFTKPTLNAAVSDGLLSIQAHDTDSGIKAIYVNGYEFTEHTNGALNIRLQQFDAGYQYFTISAMDNAGNTSEIYKTANPYYTDPENKDSSEKDPAQQLPVDASATKAIEEKVAVAKSRNSRNTKICCTRYGNVMCSRGSVIPLWIDQIKNGQPITITEPTMTRFIMSLDEAVDLVLFAFEHGENGDLLIQKAPSCTIQTQAEAVCELFGGDKKDIRIIGIRHGEKMYETLLTKEE